LSRNIIIYENINFSAQKPSICVSVVVFNLLVQNLFKNKFLLKEIAPSVGIVVVTCTLKG